MKRLILIVALAMALGACATAEKLASDLATQEQDCKANGGAFVVDMQGPRCVMPQPPPGENPDPPPPPPPDEEEPPAQPPVAPPPPEEFVQIYQPDGFFQFPQIEGPAFRGEVTFSLRGLYSASFPHHDGWLFMIRGKGSHGGEANLQFHTFLKDGRDAQIRLISQRFGDQSCVKKGAKHCESADMIAGLQLDPARTYHFRIWWDTRSASMTMATDGQPTLLWSGQNETRTWGAYAGIDWIRIGPGTWPDFPGHLAPITVINPKFKKGE